MTIAESMVADNTAYDDGGGIRNSGNMTIRHSTVSGNTVTRDQGSGGGIFNDDEGSLEVVDSTIGGAGVGNAARYAGGLLNRGSANFTRSTISGNEAYNGGGGINRGTLTFTTSTISGNSAEFVGGGLINRGTATLTGTTVSDNTADSAGGGILNNYLTPGGTDGGQLTLNSSIVAGNRAFHSDPDVRTLASIDAQFSLIGNIGSLGKVNNLGDNLIGGGLDPVIDAMLGPLQDNGGPTETHALLFGSPAIDIGNATFDDETQESDQRGLPRTVIIGQVDLPGDGADIGAFELQSRELLFPVARETARRLSGIAAALAGIEYRHR